MDYDFLPPKRDGQLHGVRRTRPGAAWTNQGNAHAARPGETPTSSQSAHTQQSSHQHGAVSPPHPNHPGFQLPRLASEQRAGASQHPQNYPAQSHPQNYSQQLPKRRWSRRLKIWLKSRTKKQWVILGIVAALLLGGSGFAIYQFLKDDSKPAAPIVKNEAPAAPPPKPLTSTLTGLPITDASVNERPVTAVMIENSPDARPQAGLSQAGVVFEAVAEGGITRFVTFFQDTTPDYLGPVRSVRPYYVQWLMGFDAAVAHVGGSADALALIRKLNVKDLDQFANPGPYRRVSNRFAPHNMYTDVGLLRARQIEKGYTKSVYTGFARKAETKSVTPNASYIDFNISGALYNVHYDYDSGTNLYKRAIGGKAHMDERAGQLAPKVVVALTMPQGQRGIYTTYQTLGSGEAHIFQDGTLIKGLWHKNTETAQFTFSTAGGTPIALNPGQTWITVLGSSARISYR